MGVWVGAAGGGSDGGGVTMGLGWKGQLAGPEVRGELTGTLHAEGLATERTEGTKNTNANTDNIQPCTQTQQSSQGKMSQQSVS